MSEQKPEGLVQMVTALQSINEQIGGHTVNALQRPNTAAVITTVIPGIGPDRIISVPLEPRHFEAIQKLLATMSAPVSLSEEARKAIGFGRRGEE